MFKEEIIMNKKLETRGDHTHTHTDPGQPWWSQEAKWCHWFIQDRKFKQ